MLTSYEVSCLMKAHTIERGRWFTIKVLRTSSGRSYFREFHDNELEKRERAKVWYWIERRANHKQIRNEQRFSKLEDDIFELKPTDQVRLPGFFYGEGVFIITHGFKKQKRKTPRKEIRKAINCRDRFLEDLNRRRKI